MLYGKILVFKIFSMVQNFVDLIFDMQSVDEKKTVENNRLYGNPSAYTCIYDKQNSHRELQGSNDTL